MNDGSISKSWRGLIHNMVHFRFTSVFQEHLHHSHYPGLERLFPLGPAEAKGTRSSHDIKDSYTSQRQRGCLFLSFSEAKASMAVKAPLKTNKKKKKEILEKS